MTLVLSNPRFADVRLSTNSYGLRYLNLKICDYDVTIHLFQHVGRSFVRTAIPIPFDQRSPPTLDFAGGGLVRTRQLCRRWFSADTADLQAVV
jgi:hypothetical protein